MRRLATFLGVLLTGAALIMGPVAPLADQAAAQPVGPVLTLTAGQGRGVVSMNGFVADPALGGATARVAVGTSVTWVLGSDEPHTVTFLGGQPRPLFVVPQPESADLPPMLNPLMFFPVPPTSPVDGRSYVNSGFLEPGNEEFSVTFAGAGRYDYVCLIHPEMTGAIEVVEAGAPGITTQAAVDQLAATHMGAVHDAQVETILATRQDPRPIVGADNTTLWSVRAGTDWRAGHLDVVAFLPAQLAVNRGDTVLWHIDHRIPHTVTFPAAGQEPPPPFDLVPQASGLPRLVYAAGAEMSRPSGVHDPAQFFNSGLFGDLANQTLGGAATWALTFEQPGTYEYFCYLHAGQGMVGTITVE